MTRRRKRPRGAPIRGAAVAEINITPMVDVLLCLLILVMVIQPGLLKGLDVQVPPPEDTEASNPAAPRDQIILHVHAGGGYLINAEPVPRDRLGPRLLEVFKDRPRKVLFVKGAEDVPYAEVIDAIDLARGAGIRVVGLVPRPPVPDAVAGGPAPELR